MADQIVPTTRTIPTRLEFARAILGWVDHASRETFAVIWAQFQAETGGTHCFCWNIGNVKHVTGDGFDFCALRGVWEGISKGAIDRLQADPIFGALVRLDLDESHQRAVGAGKIAVTFDPPHPATRFRAYLSLDVAVAEHVRFLETRYSAAWARAIAGDPEGFALALGQAHYYTADPKIYAANMRRPFEEAIASTDFAFAIALAKDDELEGAHTDPAPVFALPDPIAPDLPNKDQD